MDKFHLVDFGFLFLDLGIWAVLLVGGHHHLGQEGQQVCRQDDKVQAALGAAVHPGHPGKGPALHHCFRRGGITLEKAHQE